MADKQAPLTPEERAVLMRKVLFARCETKEQLHRWIKLFIGLDLPDCIVFEASNTCPMDMAWDIYSHFLDKAGPKVSRHLYYACRDGGKSLVASIAELAIVLHFGVDGAFMAAIEAQSGKSQQNIKGWLANPYMRDFVTGDAKETTIILRYHSPDTNESFTKEEYDKIPPNDRQQLVEVRNYIKTIICTQQGVQGQHMPIVAADEIDVVRDKLAYQNSKMIAAPAKGFMPLTVLTSTRHKARGLVQEEMDRAIDEDGHERLRVRHWNLLDVTAACPPSRHLPDRPKVPVYVDDDDLRTVSEERFKQLTPDQQSKFVKEEAFEGCITQCKMYAACRTRLATHQKSKSTLLRPLEHSENQFRNIPPNIAKSSLLCFKPSTEGLVYANLDRGVHVLTAAQIAQKVTGMYHDPNLTKAGLIASLKDRGCKFFTGMDFGFSHWFAAVTVAVDGHRAFVIDVADGRELLPDAQVRLCDKQVKPLSPTVFGDPENPQAVELFRRAGYKMRDWSKGRGSVVGGIEVVQMRLTPTIGEPMLFFLAGDPGVARLLQEMEQYYWLTDAADKPTDKPQDYDDDRVSALRYVVMNVFQGARGRIVVGDGDPNQPQLDATPTPTADPAQDWIKTWQKDHSVTSTEGGAASGQSGSIKFRF